MISDPDNSRDVDILLYSRIRNYFNLFESSSSSILRCHPSSHDSDFNPAVKEKVWYSGFESFVA